MNTFSLFTSTGLAALWQAFGGKIIFLAVEEDDKIAAMMPGVEFGHGFWRRFQAMPDGLYSRIFFVPGSEIDKKETALMLMTSLCSAGYMKIYLSDYYKMFEPSPGYEVSLCHTNLVNISSSDWQPPDKKIQSEIRKAERASIIIETFNYEKHFDKFMSLMRQTEFRHGRQPKYPAAFFKDLARLAEHDARIRWIFVQHGGEAVTSHIYFIEKDMALNWQIYFNKKFSSLKANQYILYTMARKLAVEGVRFLNLGATPVDTSGLETYKMKWGGEIYPYPCYVMKSFLGKLL